MGVVWKMQQERANASTQKIRSMYIHTLICAPLAANLMHRINAQTARKDEDANVDVDADAGDSNRVSERVLHTTCVTITIARTHGNGCTCERKHATSLGYPFERMHHLSVHV